MDRVLEKNNQPPVTNIEKKHLHSWYRIKARVRLGKASPDEISMFNKELDADEEFAESERMILARKIITHSIADSK